MDSRLPGMARQAFKSRLSRLFAGVSVTLSDTEDRTVTAKRRIVRHFDYISRAKYTDLGSIWHDRFRAQERMMTGQEGLSAVGFWHAFEIN